MRLWMLDRQDRTTADVAEDGSCPACAYACDNLRRELGGISFITNGTTIWRVECVMTGTPVGYACVQVSEAEARAELAREPS